MKQSPELDAVEARMRAGGIARDGFLGRDRRSLCEILEADRNALGRLGLTAEQVADRLTYFTDSARGGLGTTVLIDNVYQVRVESVRGVLPCPWGHAGLYPKTNVFLRNLANGVELTWTALQLHTIRDHGFFEGRGSPFRLDPRQAKEALGL